MNQNKCWCYVKRYKNQCIYICFYYSFENIRKNLVIRDDIFFLENSFIRLRTRSNVDFANINSIQWKTILSIRTS